MSTREVLLEGPSPWGFRMTGGADVALSLRISRVNPGSKAAAKAVREGDLITSINKQPTKSLTNAESHALLRTVKENLLLGLNQDPDASPKRKGHKDRYHTPVETLPPQLSATDSTNNKGDKQTPSRSRRERRKKLKTRIKRIFGLGERDKAGSDQDIWERSTEASERSSVARNEDLGSEGRSEITSAKFSEDNSSLFYDNDSTNEQFEKTVTTSEGRVTSESELHVYRDEYNTQNNEEKQECGFPIKKDPKANTSYSDVFDTCSDYLIGRDVKGRGGQEHDSVPPDIILSSNSQNNNSITETVVIKRVVEHQIVHGDVRNPTSNRSEVERELVSPIKKPNDLNNNKSGDKRAEAICSTDRISGKRVHIFHSADEYKIDETADLDNADRKQNAEESVECIPERTVNLCKAIVSFEDGGCRNVETAGNTDRPFIVLEDDASLILNSRSTNTEPCGTQFVYEETDASRTGGGPLPMYYIPVRRYLDVIKEEASDISSDSERTKESSPSVKLNLNDGNIPENWHPDGIDTSWRDGKSLDDVSDVPVASDSLSDTDLLVDDSKPPKYVPPNEHKKILSKNRIYQNINNSKPIVNRSKMPSVNVVKSVVASYYNNKSKAVTVENVKPDTAKPIQESQVLPAVTETPSIGEDVEIVYIDTSDSDALSLRSDKLVNSSSSNRSSLELLEEEILDDLTAQVDHEIQILNNLTQNENVTIRVEEVSDKMPKLVGSHRIKEKDSDKDKYAEELIELSHSIISEIAENLSSGANSRVTSARSTPCRLLSPRSTPSKDIISRFKGSTESIKVETSVKQEEAITSKENSSLSTASTTKLAQPILPLRQLSAEVIFDLPNGRNVLKELGLDPRFNYDSGSEYFPETSEYSEPSRLSFTSTEDIYGARSHSDGTHLETDPDRPLSSCASSIVFISGPGKVPVEPWIGLPLSEDPRFVVCFSPSQLSSNPIKIDQQKASELFDLHKKFIQRRGYHESYESKNLGPDLISIESNAVHEKHRYTPEILSEAANLQILQEYRNKRVNEKKESEKMVGDEEDNRGGQDKKLNLGCSGDNRKGGTESGHNEEVGGSRLLELIQKQEVKSSTSPESIMLVEKSTTGENDAQTDRSDLDTEQYSISKRGDIAIRKMKKPVEDEKVRPKSLPPSGEIFRRVMYQEYMDKVAERMERRQMKVIKVSDHQSNTESGADKARHLEAEFMNKVRERMEKLGLKEDESEETTDTQPDQETSDNLPKHLKEFVELLNEESGVWSPSGTPEAERKKFDFSSEDSIKKEERKDNQEEEDPGSAVWTPRSAGASPQLDRKKYRPINFQSPPPTRKHLGKQDEPELPKELPVRIVSSTSEGSTLSNQNSKLPPAQNPVITLLQKAREGQIPKGAQYLEQVESKTERISEASVGQHEVFYSIKKEYESDSEEKKKVVELTPRKFEGIGPITKEGTPIALRSEVKEDNQQRWYKRMYDSLHKADHDNLLPYAGWSSGYLSEPDRLYYDSDASISSKYATLDRRRAKSTRDTTSTHSDYLTTTSTLPRNTRYSAGVRHAVNIYKNQPGRIEDYEPGHSSIADKEKQQWLEEVMDIFDGEFKSHSRSENSAPPVISGSSGRSFTSVFKEGYDSDSTLVFKKREGSDLSLEDPKMAYKIIQRGGDVPLHGLRKSAPNRPREPARPRNYVPAYTPSPESGREYIESEVNIHYKTPVRVEHKEYIEEGELARRQAEALRRIYQQQRRNKYLAELNDLHARRHQDYFTPSQKSPIPLNRYDDFPVEVAPPRPRDRTPEPKLVARALYNFLGQSSRELSFRRGDIIFVRRQIDKNWYEGEHNAMIGLFPINYVEIIPYDGIRTLPKKSTEGQARAKFNFQAQTHLELSLVKGELVLLTRRVDENWFEGRIGNKKGIFPVSYVQVLVEPGEVPYGGGGKPVVAPASHSVMLNGAKDIGSQMQPPRPPSVGSPTMPKEPSQISQLLHIDTRSDPVPYRAMYNYKPQNDDELELREGDVVYVMEKCDDGWYVGSLHRNGQFGTFPGNYVQRIP